MPRADGYENEFFIYVEAQLSADENTSIRDYGAGAIQSPNYMDFFHAVGRARLKVNAAVKQDYMRDCDNMRGFEKVPAGTVIIDEIVLQGVDNLSNQQRIYEMVYGWAHDEFLEVQDYGDDDVGEPHAAALRDIDRIFGQNAVKATRARSGSKSLRKALLGKRRLRV